MRRLLSVVLASTLLLSGAWLFAQKNAATETALQSKEQAGWQAWKDHDTKAFEEMLPEDSINITGGGFDKGKQAILKSISGDCKVSGFSLSDFSYMWLAKDIVLMTYNASQDAVCGGKKLPGKVAASSIWQKKGDKWMSPFHQETVAGGM